MWPTRRAAPPQGHVDGLDARVGEQRVVGAVRALDPPLARVELGASEVAARHCDDLDEPCTARCLQDRVVDRGGGEEPESRRHGAQGRSDPAPGRQRAGRVSLAEASASKRARRRPGRHHARLAKAHYGVSGGRSSVSCYTHPRLSRLQTPQPTHRFASDDVARVEGPRRPRMMVSLRRAGGRAVPRRELRS